MPVIKGVETLPRELTACTDQAKKKGSIFKIFILRVYLWKGAVELVDGVHHVQEHVVANHKFALCVRLNG